MLSRAERRIGLPATMRWMRRIIQSNTVKARVGSDCHASGARAPNPLLYAAIRLVGTIHRRDMHRDMGNSSSSGLDCFGIGKIAPWPTGAMSIYNFASNLCPRWNCHSVDLVQ